MSIYSKIYGYRKTTKAESFERQNIVQTAKLLALPRELRDEIVSYMLDIAVTPPPYPPCAGRRQKLHDIHYPPYRDFRYPPWVWVCRQMRTECFDLVSSRNGRQRLQADLDIIFKGYLSWPTWTYLPPNLPRETPFDLNVILRIFSTEAFRSNDGWPRQPGTAFRDLLWMLNTLLHNGPSLTCNQDNKGLYRINRLAVTVSFHDDYSPDTHPETAHNILKMLKQLATIGLTNNIVGSVRARVQYRVNGESKSFEGQWNCPEASDLASMQEWNAIGFFCPAQIYSRSRYPTSHSS